MGRFHTDGILKRCDGYDLGIRCSEAGPGQLMGFAGYIRLTVRYRSQSGSKTGSLLLCISILFGEWASYFPTLD